MTAPPPMKRAFAWGLLHSGALAFHRSRYEAGRAILLLYHRVNDDGDPFFPALPRRQFAEQLDYLAGRYTVEPLESVAAWLARGAPGPPRVAITIDDGYPDTHDVVLPELTRRGFPATLFLSTGALENGQPLWIDRVRWIAKYARTRTAVLPSLDLTGRLDGVAARLTLVRSALGRLKAMPPAAIESALAEMEERLDPDGPALPLLDWEQVRRMAQGPIALGGHTHRHYMVSRLDDALLDEEIAGSARLIEERTGGRPRTFAYPNGEAADYDARAVALLRRHGFTCAVTCRHGLARPQDDPFELPRLYTTEPSLALFAARLAGLGREETAPGGTA